MRPGSPWASSCQVRLATPDAETVRFGAIVFVRNSLIQREYSHHARLISWESGSERDRNGSETEHLENRHFPCVLPCNS